MVLLCLQLVIDVHKTPPCCMLHSFPQKLLLFFRLTTFVQSVIVIKHYLQIFQAFFSSLPFGRTTSYLEVALPILMYWSNPNAQVKSCQSSEALGFDSDVDRTSVKFAKLIKVLEFLLANNLGPRSCSSSDFGTVIFKNSDNRFLWICSHGRVAPITSFQWNCLRIIGRKWKERFLQNTLSTNKKGDYLKAISFPTVCLNSNIIINT